MSQQLYDQAIDCCETCGNPLETASEVANWGQLTLLDRTVACLGRTTRLTGQQAVILRALMGRGVVSRQGLLTRLDRMGDGIIPNNVYVNVCRLRRALREVGAPAIIRTVPNLGYALEATDNSAHN